MAPQTRSSSRKPRPPAKLEAVHHVGEAAAAATEPEDDTGSPSRPSALETLPAELRILVLSNIADLNDLRAVVHASPILYQQYCLDRQRFLGLALRGTLPGPMLADAYAVRTSAVFSTTRKELEVPQVDEGITRLLNEYIALRPDPNGVLEQCSLEDLVDMASFYLGVAQPLLLEVPRRMFSKLEGAPALGALTGTERIRFLRALYRFQVFQNLFGACREPGSRFTEVKILAEFFGTFEPWEVEEVNCVHKLVWDTYDAVLGEIAWDVNKDNPRFGERSDSVTPPGAFDLEQHSSDFSLCPPGRRLNDAAQRELLHDGTVGRGLVPFHKVLRTPDHDDLVTLMQQTMTPCRGEAIDNCLRWATQYRRRSAQLSEADRREASWEKLPFSEDKEDGPPLAWVEIWTGTFSNSYGDVIPPPMHDWGYVFWDKRRLVQSGGKRELKRMWTDLWLGQDPRVEL